MLKSEMGPPKRYVDLKRSNLKRGLQSGMSISDTQILNGASRSVCRFETGISTGNFQKSKLHLFTKLSAILCVRSLKPREAMLAIDLAISIRAGAYARVIILLISTNS